MKVYLAAAYSRREELCVYRGDLYAIGVHCTSTWLDGPNQRHLDGLTLTPEIEAEIESRRFDTQSARDFARRCANQDVADVRSANLVVMFTGGGRGGGRHVEVGIAIADDMDVVLVGPRENIFHCLLNVLHFDTWPEALAMIKANR